MVEFFVIRQFGRVRLLAATEMRRGGWLRAYCVPRGKRCHWQHDFVIWQQLRLEEARRSANIGWSHPFFFLPKENRVLHLLLGRPDYEGFVDRAEAVHAANSLRTTEVNTATIIAAIGRNAPRCLQKPIVATLTALQNIYHRASPRCDFGWLM